MPSFKSVAVIGAGAWGTALAAVAARAGRDVVLYARDAASAAYIAGTRGNPKLPDLRLAANALSGAGNITEALRRALGSGLSPPEAACVSTTLQKPVHGA